MILFSPRSLPPDSFYLSFASRTWPLALILHSFYSLRCDVFCVFPPTPLLHLFFVASFSLLFRSIPCLFVLFLTFSFGLPAFPICDLFSACNFLLLTACFSASSLFCSSPVFSSRSLLHSSFSRFYFILLAFSLLSVPFLFCPLACLCLALFFSFLLPSSLLSIHPSIPFGFLSFSLLPFLRTSRAQGCGETITLPHPAQASVETTRGRGARLGKSGVTGYKVPGN